MTLADGSLVLWQGPVRAAPSISVAIWLAWSAIAPWRAQAWQIELGKPGRYAIQVIA